MGLTLPLNVCVRVHARTSTCSVGAWPVCCCLDGNTIAHVHVAASLSFALLHESAHATIGATCPHFLTAQVALATARLETSSLSRPQARPRQSGLRSEGNPKAGGAGPARPRRLRR